MMRNNDNVVNGIGRGFLNKDFRFFIYEIYGCCLMLYVMVIRTSS